MSCHGRADESEDQCLFSTVLEPIATRESDSLALSGVPLFYRAADIGDDPTVPYLTNACEVLWVSFSRVRAVHRAFLLGEVTNRVEANPSAVQLKYEFSRAFGAAAMIFHPYARVVADNAAFIA